MNMKFACTFTAVLKFVIPALLLLSGTAFCADRALGFGWNSSKQIEMVYSVDVATGETSQTGTIPDLKALAAGSFCRDSVTQAVAVLGYTVDKFNEYSGGRIFVLDPTRNTTASFLLPKLKVNFIQTLCHPGDGNLYVLGYDTNKSLFNLFLVQLIPDPSSSSDAQARLELVGTFSIPAYVATSPRIDADGVLSLIAVNQPIEDEQLVQQLFTFNIKTGETTETPLSIILQAGLMCSTTSEMFGIAYSRAEGQNVFYSVASNGAAVQIGATSEIASFKLGSQVCSGADVLLLGTNQSGDSVIFTVSATSGAVTQTSLDSSANLVALFPPQDSASNVAAFSNRQYRAGKARRFSILTAKSIKQCAKKYVSIKKASTLRKFVRASRSVEFRGKSCQRAGK